MSCMQGSIHTRPRPPPPSLIFLRIVTRVVNRRETLARGGFRASEDPAGKTRLEMMRGVTEDWRNDHAKLERFYGGAEDTQQLLYVHGVCVGALEKLSTVLGYFYRVEVERSSPLLTSGVKLH